jgi:hypothetical protein
MKNISYFFILILSCCISNATPSDYLEAYWNFESIKNGVFKDITGHGHDGVVRGQPQVVEGVVGKCLEFNGNGDYIQLIENRFLDQECKITISAWFKILGDPNERYQLFCISGDESNFDPITLQLSNGKPYDFSFEDCLTGKYVLRSNASNFNKRLERDKWYHIVATLCYDGNISTMKIYLNGNLEETVSTRAHMTNWYPLDPGRVCITYHKDMTTTIGSLYNTNYWFWNGLIDEMKVFKTCLTDQEVKDEYNLKCNSIRDVNKLSTFGDAQKIQNGWQITASALNKIGCVSTIDKKNVAGGFITNFQFKLDNSKSRADAGEGFAFVLQNKREGELGGLGDSLGFSGLNKAIAFEFDFNSNITSNDPVNNHIAVFANLNNVSSNHNSSSFIKASEIPFELKNDAKLYYSQIKYDSVQSVLKIYVSDNSDFSEKDLVLQLNDFRIIKDYFSHSGAYIEIVGTSNTHPLKQEIFDWELCLNNDIELVKQSNVCDSTSFNYSNFKNIDGLVPVFDAKQNVNSSSITMNLLLEYTKGAIWNREPMKVQNGFTTEWSFRMTSPVEGKIHETSYTGADGLAFVVQNSDKATQAIGICGSGMGYSGISNAIAAEIDLFANNKEQLEDKKDPNGNHIALFSNGSRKLNAFHNEDCVATSTNIPLLKSDGTVYFGKIEYDAEARAFKMWISETPNFKEPNLLITNFDLDQKIKMQNDGKAYVGFTAATGDHYQQHEILSWSFCPYILDNPRISSVNSENEGEKDLNAYPNPGGNFINLDYQLEKSENLELKIFNTLGVEEMQENLGWNDSGANFRKIDISMLKEGVYFAQIKGSEFSKTIRIIRQK